MSRKQYVQAIVERYRQAERQERRRILDEFCKICAYHRTHAIRKLSQARRPCRRHRKPGRPSRYCKPDIALSLLQASQGDPGCWIEPYEQTFGVLAAGVRQALADISPATIDRLLTQERLRVKRKGLSTTTPGKLHMSIAHEFY